MKMKMETRSVELGSKGSTLIGKAIVFGETGQVWDGFTETIHAGALDSAEMDDVMLLTNHRGDMIPLARYRKGKQSTMEIDVRRDAVYIRASLNTEIESHREILSAVERGDMTGMSFNFWMEDAPDAYRTTTYPDGSVHQDVYRIRKITEVSIVSNPAYPQTNVEVRDKSPTGIRDEATDRLALERAKHEFAKSKYEGGNKTC